jgi:hypothetical protein
MLLQTHHCRMEQNKADYTLPGTRHVEAGSVLAGIARQFARRRGVAKEAVERQLRARIGAAIARRAARMSLATWNKDATAVDPDTAPEFSDFARAPGGVAA